MANYKAKKSYFFSISCGKLWHIFFIIVYIINYTKILEMKEYICIIIDYSLPQDIECSSLCYTVGAYYLSILCIIVCKCQSPWSINHHIFPSNFLTLDQSVLAQKPTLPPWLLNRTDRPKYSIQAFGVLDELVLLKHKTGHYIPRVMTHFRAC